MGPTQCRSHTSHQGPQFGDLLGGLRTGQMKPGQGFNPALRELWIRRAAEAPVV